MQRGVVGAKPRDFCRWVFALLNAQPGDIFSDLFPGSGAVSAAWAEWTSEGEEPAADDIGRNAPAGCDGFKSAISA